MASGDFRTGLMDCTADMGICMTVFCCWETGCPSANSWALSRHENCGMCHWCAQPHPLWTRANIRKMNTGRHDEADYCSDWFVYCLCAPCAICQDARELKLIQQEGGAGYASGPLNTETSLTSMPGDQNVQRPAAQPIAQGYGIPSYTHGNSLK